ncbi:hypothetical protein [Streptomyces tanashiensis]|uniref:hypothetical protein n=1 Tax=Streptomyces tanashiensis TaxID=67367 RepID=UPI001677D72B|nr:hypothetical protein [Streptomyces tanashiensis]
MHARRTTFLLLIALLTTGCVAVPHGRAPAPPARPGGLAPAADRPPAPLPTWPAPTEPAPREVLTATEPRPAAPPARTSAGPAADASDERPSAGRAPVQGPAANRPHTTANRPRKPEQRNTGTRTSGNRKSGSRKTAHTKTGKSAAGNGTAGTRAIPRAPQKNRPATVRPPRQTDGRPPEMRGLCHQAETIRAPMGAADLCRGMYGR